MSAASCLPILSVAPSPDYLPPLADNLIPIHPRPADILAVMANQTAAHRFARTPGPAEQAVALDRPSLLTRRLDERRTSRSEP